jgi:beta-glucanase (GH16 family)
MLPSIKRLSSKGFGHIELFLVAMLLVGISSVGYYVFKHATTSKVSTYTELTTITAGGVNFSEKACIVSRSGTAPNYYDIVDAVISVNKPAGQSTEISKNGQVIAGSGYNPVVFYSINSSVPVKEDNWVSSSISTINFTLPASPQSDSFNLGVETIPSSGVAFSGSSQTIGSLELCSSSSKTPVSLPKLQALIPFIKTTTSGPTTTTTTVIKNPVTNKTTTTTTTTNSVTKKTITSTTVQSTTQNTPNTPSPLPLTILLSAAPTSVTSGGTSTLAWNTTNASSCTASNAWSGSKPTSGSIVITSLVATSSYTLNCTGPGGNVSATTTITVTPAIDGCSVAGIFAPCIGSSTTGASGWGTPVFDDEFNESSLDATKWSTGWFASGITTGANSLEQECMDPAQVSVSGGALNLTAIAKSETCGGVAQNYASGMVTTRGLFDFTYGYMEAKIWLPGTTSIADWPAFWLIGPNWPTSGEIDIMEGLGGQAEVHYHNTTGSLGPLIGSGNYAGSWHTFGANWQSGTVTYYYDGVNIGSLASTSTSPMYLILNLALSTSITSPNTVPATMKVDYVRVWQ